MYYYNMSLVIFFVTVIVELFAPGTAEVAPVVVDLLSSGSELPSPNFNPDQVFSYGESSVGDSAMPSPWMEDRQYPTPVSSSGYVSSEITPPSSSNASEFSVSSLNSSQRGLTNVILDMSTPQAERDAFFDAGYTTLSR